MATDRSGKLTYQMVSPGEAWNNFMNSKEGNNASVITPSYLESNSNPVAVKPKLFKEAMEHQNGKNLKEQAIQKEEMTMEK